MLPGANTQRVGPVPAQTYPSYRKYDAGASPLCVTLATRCALCRKARFQHYRAPIRLAPSSSREKWSLSRLKTTISHG